MYLAEVFLFLLVGVGCLCIIFVYQVATGKWTVKWVPDTWAIAKPEFWTDWARPPDYSRFGPGDKRPQPLGATPEEERIKEEERDRQWRVVINAAASEVEQTLLMPFDGFSGTSALGRLGSVSIWCFFKTDYDLAKATQTTLARDVEEVMQNALLSRGYPSRLIYAVSVRFVSDEDVQRISGGSRWDYMR